MGHKFSRTLNNAGSKNYSKQASGFSKSAQARPRISMVQNVLLIWLDGNIDEQNSVDCQNTITQLRRVVNTVKTFTDGNQCIEFLETTNNEKVCMVISGSLGQHIVPRIHDMSQIDSIFIFCGNKTYHEQWAKEWCKIKGVFTEISPICDALKETAQQAEQNLISISIMNTISDISNKKLDQLDPTFMYTQIFKEILLSIKFEQQHIKEFINYCREQFVEIDDNLKTVDELEREYHQKTPVWWYTYESFLFSMVNYGIRTMDGDIMIKMGFFISDLHRQIEQLHEKQFRTYFSAKTFTIYRGQALFKADFDQLKNSKGGLMSFNSFLSTSKDRDTSLSFANEALADPNSIGILFVMTINPSKSTTPFASINGISYFPAEDEVLFSMHTVFRICDIKPMDDTTRLFQVDLTLTNDNDKDLCALTDLIRKETEGSTGWYQLGELLLKMGQSKKAQEVYEVLLDQTTDKKEKGNIYSRLGLAKYNTGEYQEAITFYENSLKMYKESLPSNHSNLAATYNNIGLVYNNMDEYSKALFYYEKALEISQKSLRSNHPSLAMSYNNIGSVYYNMEDYSKALSYYDKDLQISKNSLPSNHPDLAKSYNNIGNAYMKMRDYSKALSSHEKALEIRQQSLPSNHSDLAMSYNNMGNVYKNMGEYSKACSYYERAVDIGQRSLPSNHPYLQQYKRNLDLTKK